jgi:hypothetical protein
LAERLPCKSQAQAVAPGKLHGYAAPGRRAINQLAGADAGTVFDT